MHHAHLVHHQLFNFTPRASSQTSSTGRKIQRTPSHGLFWTDDLHWPSFLEPKQNRGFHRTNSTYHLGMIWIPSIYGNMREGLFLALFIYVFFVRILIDLIGGILTWCLRDASLTFDLFMTHDVYSTATRHTIDMRCWSCIQQYAFSIGTIGKAPIWCILKMVVYVCLGTGFDWENDWCYHNMTAIYCNIQYYWHKETVVFLTGVGKQAQTLMRQPKSLRPAQIWRADRFFQE